MTTLLVPQLKNLSAREVMTARIGSLLPSTPIPAAIHELLTRKISELPIATETGEYVGMFSDVCGMRVMAAIGDMVNAAHLELLSAADAMTPARNLLTFTSRSDALSAVEALLKHRTYSAPVVVDEGHFLGMFSEKTCMNYVIEAAYGGLPKATVGDFVDQDGNGLISGETNLHEVARTFMKTTFQSLPISKNSTLSGTVSRAGLLGHSKVLASIMKHHISEAASDIDLPDDAARVYVEACDTLPDQTVMAFVDRRAIVVPPDMSLFSVAQQFFRSPLLRFPVVDEGQLIGMISRSDVLQSALRTSSAQL